MKSEQQFLESVLAKRDLAARKQRERKRWVATLCVMLLVLTGTILALEDGLFLAKSGESIYEGTTAESVLHGNKGDRYPMAPGEAKGEAEGTVGDSQKEEVDDVISGKAVLEIWIGDTQAAFELMPVWRDSIPVEDSGILDEPIPRIAVAHGTELKLKLAGDYTELLLFTATERAEVFREERAVALEKRTFAVTESGFVGIEKTTKSGSWRYLFQVEIL